MWGTTWGEKGYVRIKKDAGKGPGICGVATYAAYPIWNNKL